MADPPQQQPSALQTAWTATLSGIGGLAESILNGMLGIIRPSTRLVANEMSDILGNIEATAWEALKQAHIDAGLLDANSSAAFDSYRDLTPPFDTVAYLSVWLRFVLNSVTIASEPSALLARQAAYDRLRPSVPDVSSVLRAAFIAPEKTAEVREIMARQGLPDDMIDLVFIAAYRTYSEETIKILFLRGVLTDAAMRERMRELGYTDTRINEIVQSWEVLPPISDLLYMVGKEAFEPDIYTKYGLNAEFPEEQVDYMAQQGISRFWAEKYWIAHWQQPSIGQGYQMLQRQDPDNPGSTIIGLDDLDALFRAVEIPPFWRDKLRKIAYTPYARVDVRRMHDLGVLSDEDLVWAYKDQGYDEEKALNLARFTIRFNRENDRDLTKSQIVDAYFDKIIDRDQALQMLEDINYNRATAEYLLAYAQYEQNKKFADDAIRNIKDRFINNLMTDNEASDALDRLDIAAERKRLLLDQWELDRFLDRKLPSKSDVDEFYQKGIIDLDDWRQEMRNLGYSFRYIAWYERSMNRTPSRTDLNSFRESGQLNVDQWRDEMAKLGYSANDIDKYNRLFLEEQAS